MTDERDELLALKLEAEGLGGLAPLLLRLRGLPLDEQVEIERAVAVGGQAIVCLAHERATGRKAAARLAFLPYHRPAYIRQADLLAARRRIELDAQRLEQFAGSPLPASYGLRYAPNPLCPSEWEPAIIAREPFLLTEFIEGASVQQEARRLRGSDSPGPPALARLIFAIAGVVAELGCRLESCGLVWADTRPENLLLDPSSPAWPVRIVDPGSIVPLNPAPDDALPISVAYAPPADHPAWSRANGTPWPSVAVALYMLGKTLWSLAANRPALPGVEPDLAAVGLPSEPVRLLIRQLLAGEFGAFGDLASFLASPALPTDAPA